MPFIFQNLQSLSEEEISEFLGELSSVTENNAAEVVSSPANIGAIVGILNSVANIRMAINKALMTVGATEYYYSII